MTSQPFNYTGPPPPAGYGFQIMSQGDQLTGKNLLCQRCGALVADEPYFKDEHDKFHARIERTNDLLNELVLQVKQLKEQYLIQEEP